MRWPVKDEPKWKRRFAFFPVKCFTPKPMWIWLEFYYQMKGKSDGFGGHEDDVNYTKIPE